jgi:hypothetical protein
MPTKFSQFQAGAPIVDTDQVVGFNTDNKRWTASQLKAYIGQVVTSWDGSTVPVNVTAGAGVSITNGVISFTGDANVDLQDAYDNSADGNTNLVAGKEVTWTSTEAGIRPPAMTQAQADLMITPSTGSTVFIIDDNRLANNRGTPATPDIERVAYLSDIPVIVNDGAYAELSLQNNTTETIITTAGVPVQIAGTYILGPVADFFNIGGQGILTYTGAETRVFKVSFTITTTADLTAVDVTASIGLNGAPVPSSQQTEYLGSTTSAEHVINVQALIQLSTNDTLNCLIQNNTNADNILVSSLNFTPTSIGGTSNVTNDQVVVRWNGSTNQVAVTAGANMDITAGVISTTAEPNVVTEWNGSTTPVQVTAGTDIDIANGVISYTGSPGGGVVTSWNGSTNPVSVTAGAGIDITNGVITNTGGGGGGAQSGNFNIGTCLVPRTVFQFGNYLSVIDQLQGTQTIAPASLAVGESVKMRFTYELNPTLPTLSTVSGSFQYVFGNSILNPPPNVNLILNNSAQRTGFIEYSVTRNAINEVTIDATGWYITTSPVAFAPVVPAHTGIFTTTLPYDENLSYLFDVKWARVTGDVNNYLDVKALNLMIDQHTQRVGAGGTQVVESWNGGTAPVDVTAGNLIDITGGIISTTAEQNVVTSWDGSAGQVAVTAGTGISIAGGVISTTGASFQQYFLDAVCLEPRGLNTQYTPNTYEDVWVTLFGPAGSPLNNVPALSVGNTVQIRSTGVLNSVTSGGTGQLRLNFGGVFSITSPVIDFSASTVTRAYDLNVTITNVTGTDVQCTIAGGYFDKNNTYRSWGMFVTPALQPYTPSTQALTLQWNANVSPGNFFDFLAFNLNIERFYTI